MDPELSPSAEPLPPALQSLEEFKTRGCFLSGAVGLDTSAYNARGELSLDEDTHWMDLPATFGEYCDYEALEAVSDYDSNRDSYSSDDLAQPGVSAAVSAAVSAVQGLRSHPLQDPISTETGEDICNGYSTEVEDAR